jgi:hypothetical protein
VTKRTKLRLLLLPVAALVVVAAKVTCDTVRPPSRVYTPPGWRDLSAEEREKRLDEEERRRRKSGRGASRQLPEDRAAKAPAKKAGG